MWTRRTLLAAAGAAFLPPMRVQAQAKGRFVGRVVTEWLPDNRNMKLLESFEFIGADGRRWPVPAGIVVDGASIPQAFWSITGGPFEGAYRNASVVHDHYCVTRTRPHRDVHRAFFDGMLAAGVGDKRAWLMYQAVDRFGPSWDDPKIDPRCEVVDANYDFEKCARNSSKPAARVQDPSRSEIEQFLKAIGDAVDPEDVRKLRETPIR